ncbi:MAG: outer membrane beta-barrel protein [Alistipes sp.]|nr:outer membrane beta-barrel protein [Alistipes sp.]
MKRIKNTRFGAAILIAAALLGFPKAQAQEYSTNAYANIDWQFNVPLGASFADKASGWGMNFEGGYYFPNNMGIGAFFAYHTNNQYIPRQTFAINQSSAVTTDQQHSVYQVPFGVTGRYRFVDGNTYSAYVALKLGTNYARISSDFYILEAYQKTWGFYLSPEVGMTIHPLQTILGLHMALYYSYATNQGTVMTFKTDQLNNFGFRIGLGF